MKYILLLLFRSSTSKMAANAVYVVTGGRVLAKTKWAGSMPMAL